MLRIFSGNQIVIEEAIFDRTTILDNYLLPNQHEAVKFVIVNDNKIVSVQDYRDILLKHKLKGNLILSSKDAFDQARDYFKGINNLYSNACLGVVREDGSLDYIIEYRANVNYVEEDRQKHFYPFETYHFNPEEVLQEGKSLLKENGIFVFEKAEEYTVHIANVLCQLNKRGKQYCLYTLDPVMQNFFDKEEITVVSDVSLLEKEKKYIMVISEAYRNTLYKDTDIRKCYKSLEIMTLFYKNAIENELNPKVDKKFMILEDRYWSNGLVDLMKFNIRNKLVMDKLGYIPVIYCKINSMYSDNFLVRENIWSNYFCNVNEYNIDQAYASNNYEVVSRSYIEMREEVVAKLGTLNIKNDVFYWVEQVSWKQEILEYCESELPKKFFEGKRILGVIARGTDYNPNAVVKRYGTDIVKNTCIEQFIEKVENEMLCGGYDYMYLATEDSINYRKFKERFGDKLLSANQERYDLERNKEYVSSFLFEYPRQKDGFENGLEYLSIIYSLSRCESLISSMPCGAYVASMVFNHNKYLKAILTNQ